MKYNELKNAISEDAIRLSGLYPDVESARARLLCALADFGEKYGTDGDIILLSAPGRSEICGNHTDHNGGCAVAGAVTRDIIAFARREDDGIIRIQSRGRVEDVIPVEKTLSSDNFRNYCSASLIAGVAGGFHKRGYRIGGFSAYTTTEVLSGSGISSSAAFEVMVGNILNHLYNDGKIAAGELAKIAQYAENEYYGKPSGLMDQMASAVGGFVFMDFGDKESPEVIGLRLSLRDAGYRLCIVGTGGSHSDLNDDYAAVPGEMRAVASELGRELLSGVTYDEILSEIPRLRKSCGDRAVLRALHFVSECDRARRARECIERGEISGLLSVMNESGHSSFEYLQNVYTSKNVTEQGLSLALLLSERYLAGVSAAARVHGGGFAGTIQAIMPSGMVDGYISLMEPIFGEGAVMVLDVRDEGAIRIF